MPENFRLGHEMKILFRQIYHEISRVRDASRFTILGQKPIVKGIKQVMFYISRRSHLLKHGCALWKIGEGRLTLRIIYGR